MVAALAEFPSGRPEADRPRLHLVQMERRPTAADYRRRRVMVLGVGVLMVVLVAIAVQSALERIGGGPLATSGAASAGSVQPVAARAWVVRPGDTLWSIALALDPHGDVRPLVDRLAGQTGGAPLYPGEVIQLP